MGRRRLAGSLRLMATDPDCIFCKIVAGELPATKVDEDDRTIAFMDINPGTHGHALVIPKEHAQRPAARSRQTTSRPSCRRRSGSRSACPRRSAPRAST